MATAEVAGADWNNGQVFIDVMYDTTTLKLTTIEYQNLSPKPARMTVTGPSNFQKDYILAANTPPASRDLSADNIQLVAAGGTSKDGRPNTGGVPPPGWSVSFAWPA